MKRESLDTNVLLRLMCKDVPAQYELAKRLVTSERTRFFVSDTAVTEFVFALERHYKFSRSQIQQAVQDLLSITTIDCNRELISVALELYCTHKSLSYEDCYFAASAETMNAAPLWTFDKDLASKLSSAKLLTRFSPYNLSHLVDSIPWVGFMLADEQKGIPVNVHDETNGFATDPYKDEAAEMWGHTDAYKESQRRTQNYSAADWDRYKIEAADINDRFVALMQSQTPADSPEAHALAEEHRQLISRWFYECPPEMHANFGALWESDQRFKKNIDKAAEGLSAYMAEAFQTAAAA
ncbi:MAG: TipAS antibiotic-recognition domain-containing protein [Coriobacteriia bacterium]|nr:TipAS antibiotic-recognition domain-containing protein [Coriobacteriia bacterium]